MKIYNLVLKLLSILIGVIVGLNEVLNSFTIMKSIASFSLIIIVFIPDILRKINIKISNIMEFIFLLFLFLGFTLGFVLGLYHTLFLYDKFVHFTSGIIMSIIGIYILIKFNKYNSNSYIFNSIIMVFFTMFIASFWEILEFIASLLFNTDPQSVQATGVTDTMIDLILALIGSIIVSLYYIYNNRKKNDVIVKRFITCIK